MVVRTKRRAKLGMIASLALLVSFAICSIVPMIYSSAAGIDTRAVNLYTADMLNVGDYISEFGTYKSRKLSWRVISKDEQGVMLRTEYVLSNSDGSADVHPYSDLNYKPSEGFINPLVSHTSTKGDNGGNRNDYGTNYWEQSSLRTYLNDGFMNGTNMYGNNGTSWFDDDEKAAIVTAPNVKTILHWTELVSSASDSNLNYTEASPVNSKNYRVSDSTSSQDPKPIDPNYQTAQGYSGKETINGDPNDSRYHYYATIASSDASIQWAYSSSYYNSTDAVFLAPYTTIVDATDSLKSPNGGNFKIGKSYNDTAVQTMTGLPSLIMYEISGISGIYSLQNTNTKIKVISSAGSHTDNNASSNNSIMPSVYLNNNTVLEKTGSKTNSGESSTVGVYELSGETYGSGEAQSPTIYTTSIPDKKAGDEWNFQISTNLSNNIVFSISSGSLPQGLAFDNDTGVISGRATERGDFPVTITVSNNFGSASQQYTITINWGDPQEIENLPTNLTAYVLQSYNDLVLPSNFRVEDSGLIFTQATNEGDVGTPVRVLYNPDRDVYTDKDYTVYVRVSQEQQTEPTTPHGTIYGKVGQKLGDLVAQLEPYYTFADENVELDGVDNEYEITLLYNTNTTAYSAYPYETTMVVDKGEPKIPGTTPSFVDVTTGMTTEDLIFNDNNWRWKNTKSFTTIGQHGVTAIYEPDPDNYEPYETTIDITVTKGVHKAPDDESGITLEYFVDAGTYASDIELPNGYYSFEGEDYYLIGNSTVPLYILYNTDSYNYYDYRYQVNVYVSRMNSDGPTDEELPDDLVSTVGSGISDIESQLMQSKYNGSWRVEAQDINGDGIVEQDEVFTTTGYITIYLIYNIDVNIYNDYTGVEVRVKINAAYHDEPATRPAGFTARITESVSSLQSQLDSFMNETGLIGFSFRDPDNVFEYLNETSIMVEYNTDPDNFTSYSFSVNVNVIRKEGLTPSEVPSFEAVDFGTLIRDLKLPEHYMWEDSSIKFDKDGEITVIALYNEDSGIYEDTKVQIIITVNPAPNLDEQVRGLLQNPYFLVGTSMAFAAFVFFIAFIIIKGRSKSKKVPTTNIGNRPANYGRNRTTQTRYQSHDGRGYGNTTHQLPPPNPHMHQLPPPNGQGYGNPYNHQLPPANNRAYNNPNMHQLPPNNGHGGYGNPHNQHSGYTHTNESYGQQSDDNENDDSHNNG